LQVPEWMWEEIAMDFIVGLLRTQSGYDSIWVIVDRLTKLAHIVPIKTTYSRPQLVERRRGLCLTEGPNSLQCFGRGCMKPRIPNCIIVLPIILRLVVGLRE
jgi:hypothetical protein